ncbi:MAG: hypothetical protein A3H32_20190 [Betaproteobacteria bacterium RIFCSPLOWO2_02_FULL_63_19]|nr:MAG: hypothetical protein A3H32_20190 [Betaproteobacteria bacterium RIFCSPLOWO2_02_FULL_63_19]
MRYAIRILVVLAFSLASISLWALDLTPGQGAVFTQVSYPDISGGANTSIGMIRLDLNTLRNQTGMLSGYVNVATDKGWVVRNVPVFAENVYPYSAISTAFDLGVQIGTAVTQLTAAVQYTEDLKTSFSATPATVFPVAPRNLSMGGAGVSGGGPLTTPNLTDVLFADPTNNDTYIQWDHPNAEAANNQCMPMSVANSLQYLKDTQGLNLPHEHKAGLKGDNTLVGQLDTSMNRTVPDTTNRRDPNATGVWGLQGKLTYLATNNLNGRISTTHWGVGGPDSGANNVSQTVNGVTATSTGKGSTVNFDQVRAALKEEQDCELVVSWAAGGAHAVDIVGAGVFNGQLWILEASDVDQGDDAKGAGGSGFLFHWLTKPAGSTQYEWDGNKIEQVICEKYIPPPPTETFSIFSDPAGHSCCVDVPPSTLDISLGAFAGATLSINGSASWMPLSGTIGSDGTFSLTGSGTVAGFSNVSSSFTGSVTNTGYSGKVTVGTQGELYGTPISWNVTITDPTVAARPAVRMNGFRHDYAALASDLLRLSVSMKAAAQAGPSVDWWMVTVGPAGVFYFDLAAMSWKSGLVPTYTGPLGDLPFFALPYLNLSAGTYDIYFGFDTVPNGSLDMQSATYDMVRVTVN